MKITPSPNDAKPDIKKFCFQQEKKLYNENNKGFRGISSLKCLSSRWCRHPDFEQLILQRVCVRSELKDYLPTLKAASNLLVVEWKIDFKCPTLLTHLTVIFVHFWAALTVRKAIQPHEAVLSPFQGCIANRTLILGKNQFCFGRSPVFRRHRTQRKNDEFWRSQWKNNSNNLTVLQSQCEIKTVFRWMG